MENRQSIASVGNQIYRLLSRQQFPVTEPGILTRLPTVFQAAQDCENDVLGQDELDPALRQASCPKSEQCNLFFCHESCL